MTRRKNNLGAIVLLGVAALFALIVAGKLVKYALFAGIAYAVYKLFLSPEKPEKKTLAPPLALPMDPLDLHPIERAMDEERVRLDRELEQAILASRTQQQQ